MIPSQGMRRQLVSIAITRKLACHRKTSTKHDAGKLQNNLREKKPAKQSAWEPGTWSHATSRPTLICLYSCIFVFINTKMYLSICGFVYFCIGESRNLWTTSELPLLTSAAQKPSLLLFRPFYNFLPEILPRRHSCGKRTQFAFHPDGAASPGKIIN